MIDLSTRVDQKGSSGSSGGAPEDSFLYCYSPGGGYPPLNFEVTPPGRVVGKPDQGQVSLCLVTKTHLCLDTFVSAMI